MAAEKNRYGESKSSFENRARRKGFWEKYVKDREMLKKVFVGRGMDPKEAAQAAWLKISAQFVLEPEAPASTDPPIDRSLPASGAALESKCPFPLLEREDFGAETVTSPRQIVEWVANNVMIAGVKPVNAPTPWAWGMLQLARSSIEEFGKLRDTWSKLLPTKTQIDKSDSVEDDGRLLGVLDRVEAASRTASQITEPGASDQRSGP